MNEVCLECGGGGVPLLFGLPVPEARAAAVDGALALGGCLLPADAALEFWQCPLRHRWAEPDRSGWEARLDEILAGYRTSDGG